MFNMKSYNRDTLFKETTACNMHSGVERESIYIKVMILKIELNRIIDFLI